MADDKTTDTKSTDTAAKPASTGGLKTDTYGKAAPKGDTAAGDPMNDPELNDFADLEPGESKVVDSGPSTGMNPPASPNGEQVARQGAGAARGGYPGSADPGGGHRPARHVRRLPGDPGRGCRREELQDRQDSRR
jgi:hypothetical protein